MILAGSLDEFSLPDILQLLMQQKKSGVLRLTRRKEKAEIHISQGNVSGVRVGAKTPETKILEMLVESGRVERREFGQMRDLSESMQRPPLLTLMAKGHLTEEEKDAWIQLAAEDMVCDLFAWTEGEYSFDAQQRGAHGALLSISTDFACMEGMRRLDEWSRLGEMLPHGNMIFRPTGRMLEADDAGFDRWVLEILDGHKTLADLEKELPFGRFRLYEIMAGMWSAGVVAAEDGPAPQSDLKVPASLQSEKDQKTALVAGVAVLVFLLSAFFRFAAISLFPSQASGEYGALVQEAIDAENVETFLLDYASRRDKLPDELLDLVREKIFHPRELKKASGRYFVYEKGSGGDFQLK